MIPLHPRDFEMIFRELSQRIPLEAFSFAGSLLEEIVSPIPSYLVMGIVGSLAFAQKLSPLHLVLLMFLGALGKTLGAGFYYVVGDSLEDMFRGTLSKFFRVSPEKIESFGKKFTGNHWKDGGIIFIFRLFPLTPTTVFSLACGVLKMNFKVYFLATLIGNFCKDVLYVLLGYYGFASVSRLWKQIHWYKVEFEWVLAFFILGICITFFFQSDIWKTKKKEYLNWRKKFE